MTRWAKFASTDETVVKVDDAGRVTVEGHGEASITVWYASQVADDVTITVALPDRDRSRRSSPTPRGRTPIDEKNLAKLESLRIPPSPDCGDAAFLRRAYARRDRHAADGRGGRRRSSPTAIPRSGRSSSIGCSQARNTSITGRTSGRDLLPRLVEQAARAGDVVVLPVRPPERGRQRAVGQVRPRRSSRPRASTLKNGAANYFVLHRDPIDLTESASMAFLGLSLTCARCHNHPMEKWTQDQYYGMASLFSRVRLKDGGAAGDVVVMPAAERRDPPPADGCRDAPAAARRQGRCPSTTAATAARRSPTGSPRPTTRTSPARSSTASGGTSSAAGLIDPEDDLRATNPASDEPLLDWLVADFLAHGYDVKHLIRTIMTSAVYARSSVPVRGQRVGREVPEPLPGQAAAGRGAARRDRAGDRRAHAASPAIPPAGGACSSPTPRSRARSSTLVRPSRAAEHMLVRAVVRAVDGPGLAPGQRRDDQREAPRSAKGAVAKAIAAGRVRRRDHRPPLPRRPVAPADRRRADAALEESSPMPSPARPTRKLAAEARRQAIEDLYWATLTGKSSCSTIDSSYGA